MGKRVEFLLREIREQSFSKNSTFSDDVFVLYLNEAQNAIRKTIFLSNNESNILKNTTKIAILNGVLKYNLPERMYAENSILAVRGKYSSLSDDEPYQTLQPVSIRNYGRVYGYTLVNNQIWLSTVGNSSDLVEIEIFYSGTLRSIQKRGGKVSGIAGNILTLSDYDDEIDLKADCVTAVKKDNTEIATDLEIVTFNSGLGTIELSSVVGINIGDYILSGEFSTNISTLPNLCEDYLKKYVERRIAKEDSSEADTRTTDYFTVEEKADIAAIFAQSSEDVMLPEFSPNSPVI